MRRLRHRAKRQKLKVIIKDGCSCCHLPFVEDFQYHSTLLSQHETIVLCWWCFRGWYDAGLTTPTELAAWSKGRREETGGVIPMSGYGA